MNDTDNQIPKPRPLANKPLVEAIFELRWGLRRTNPAVPPRDPGFRIFLGRYYDRVRSDYPHVQDLPTVHVPEEFTAHAVRHQFRVGKDQWPLTQVGPGIVTVNETGGYDWKTFQPRLVRAIAALFESYPTDVAPFAPEMVQLRYIDAIPYEPSKMTPTQFLKDLLHTNITVDPQLFDDAQTAGQATEINLTLTFPLTQPTGVGILAFATGLKEGQPSIILQITIRSEGLGVPKQPAGYEAWLQDAHNVVGKWFFTLCRGSLLESFETTNANHPG
jgi:uncharacterized protein (TIGR04255 family)